MSRDQRDNGIAKGAKSVHPAGKPISHSTNRGLSRRGPVIGGDPAPVGGRSGWPKADAATFRLRLWLPLTPLRGEPSKLASVAVAVGQRVANSARFGCPPSRRSLWHIFGSLSVVAVGQREQSLSAVRCPDLSRREYSRRNPIAHCRKLAADLIESEG